MKTNKLTCIVPYEKDLNSEAVNAAKGKIAIRGNIVTGTFVKTETSGYNDPPGVAITYEALKRKIPEW